ncbi:hypothetical protein WCE39_01525 [Luteimonas sp. MJ174]|uniref:hypothetical protein n=1 Tax=Luteimonas sp. MJ174 TaxID=3129237 RepID=UPI0031BA238D
MTTSLKLYHRLVKADRSGQDASARQAIARNALRQVAANSLQEIGDQIVNAKTVLPWLFASLGVPTVLIGLLVPIRESGSMLPQAALTPWIRRLRQRRSAWVAGSAGQAVATAAMAFAAATLGGVTAGLVILAALAGFALARSLCSLAGKDVMGRTVPKGERGQVSGISTMVSGAVAITLGLGIRWVGGGDIQPMLVATLLGAAALAWVLAAAVFSGIVEAEPDGDEADRPPRNRGSGWLRASWRLLADDAPFRRFVLARTLLLVSALSPPFVVALAASAGDVGLGGLGPFVIAQGLASLIGGRGFGRLADRSSRQLMVVGAAFASLVVLLFLGALAIPGMRGQWWLYPVVYLLLALTHTGVRVARKTYVVDMAEGDLRTAYVAVANTAMGALLLVVGGVSGALASLGTEVALGFLALLGLAGVLVARNLPEVSRHG